MPFVTRTKASKALGLQTYKRVQNLPDDIQKHELVYLDMRDWYMNTLALKAQYEEMLQQAKTTKDKELQQEAGNKIAAINAKITDYRQRLKSVGQASYAEAFYMCASHMLTSEAKKQIELATDDILGRPRDELKRMK